MDVIGWNIIHGRKKEHWKSSRGSDSTCTKRLALEVKFTGLSEMTLETEVCVTVGVSTKKNSHCHSLEWHA